jgi:hypothetical protein
VLTGCQHRGPGDVAALVPDRGHDAEDHVADQRLVEVGEAPAQLVDQPDH